jgi:hypothetical protein
VNRPVQEQDGLAAGGARRHPRRLRGAGGAGGPRPALRAARAGRAAGPAGPVRRRDGQAAAARGATAGYVSERRQHRADVRLHARDPARARVAERAEARYGSGASLRGSQKRCAAGACRGRPGPGRDRDGATLADPDNVAGTPPPLRSRFRNSRPIRARSPLPAAATRGPQLKQRGGRRRGPWATPASRVGAGRLARVSGVSRQCLLPFIAGFPTPPSKPGVRLSPHRAFQGPAFLSGDYSPVRNPLGFHLHCLGLHRGSG